MWKPPVNVAYVIWVYTPEGLAVKKRGWVRRRSFPNWDPVSFQGPSLLNFGNVIPINVVDIQLYTLYIYICVLFKIFTRFLAEKKNNQAINHWIRRATTKSTHLPSFSPACRGSWEPSKVTSFLELSSFKFTTCSLDRSVRGPSPGNRKLHSRRVCGKVLASRLGKGRVDGVF